MRPATDGSIFQTFSIFLCYHIGLIPENIASDSSYRHGHLNVAVAVRDVRFGQERGRSGTDCSVKTLFPLHTYPYPFILTVPKMPTLSWPPSILQQGEAAMQEMSRCKSRVCV